MSMGGEGGNAVSSGVGMVDAAMYCSELWSLRAGHEGCAWLRGHGRAVLAGFRWRVRVDGGER